MDRSFPVVAVDRKTFKWTTEFVLFRSRILNLEQERGQVRTCRPAAASSSMVSDRVQQNAHTIATNCLVPLMSGI